TAGGQVSITSGFQAPSSLPDPTPTVTLQSKAFNQTAVNGTNDIIDFGVAHGLVTGQAIVYRKGGSNTAIGGLTDGQTYYVIVVNATAIKLAASQGDALADIPIHLTSTGSGTGHSLAGVTSFDAAADVTLQDNSIDFGVAHGLSTGQSVTYHGTNI